MCEKRDPLSEIRVCAAVICHLSSMVSVSSQQDDRVIIILSYCHIIILSYLPGPCPSLAGRFRFD